MKRFAALWHNKKDREAIYVLIGTWVLLPILGLWLDLHGLDLYSYLAFAFGYGLVFLISLIYEPLRKRPRMRDIIAACLFMAFAISQMLIGIEFAIILLVLAFSNLFQALWRK
jgi:hypothetical protein